MFTGIIEELGNALNIHRQDTAMQVRIDANAKNLDINLGSSIAVNGVCLTVTQFDTTSFCVDIMPETFNATALKYLKVGDTLNLEASMQPNGRLGGHFVTGHVDDIGHITAIIPNNNALDYHITPNDNTLLKYCIMRGSIAIDGTSLTIFAIDDATIKLSLIPHTVKYSVLGYKQVGDMVNIEYDMLGKYVISHLEQTQTNR